MIRLLADRQIAFDGIPAWVAMDGSDVRFFDRTRCKLRLKEF